ncbi:MAG: response regulator, partial [Pedobacter sp.]
VYHQKTKKLFKWADIEGISKVSHFKSVYAIVQDADSSVWLGTSGYGLLHLKLKITENQNLQLISFKQYLSSENELTGPANDIIYALAKGKDSKLWIACRYGGLSTFDTKKQTFKTYKALGTKGSLSHSDVLSLYYDSKDRLWIGTSFGLNMLSAKESKTSNPNFTNFTTDNGLPNNTIHAIQEDESGKIWLSTNRGLAKLNPTNNAIANYLESDGLQSNEFSDGAVYKAANHTLIFGGIYGFNFFNPKFITGNVKQPNLFIYDLQFGGKALQNNQFLIVNAESKQFHTYEIERKNNFFQFSFNALNYFNASKSEFAYKLKGLDRAWRFSGSDGKISYYNIPPVNYDLLVRWSNGEGVWTTDVIALHIDVKQYFWLTIPAYICYFILAAVAVYAFHLYRKNKLEMKFRLERETLFRQKDDEIHSQRINFFTNIAHEIQTPLTLILGSVEHFMQKQNEPSPVAEKNNFLSLVHQHTARLTYLVQQLLEFRKAEAGYVKRNDDYMDISKLLNGLTQLFVPVAEKNNQTFVREIPADMASFIDKDKYEKILFNLLSNAFKYADKNESILFKVNFDSETQTLQTIVANSGCKLQADELEKLFTEFHVADDNQFEKFSTGIGLAFTKELINILDGDIKVYLKKDWIYFDFALPINSLNDDKKEEVITSTPSYLFESILKPYEKDEVDSVVAANKNTLIEDLQEKNEQSVLIVEDDVALRFLLKNILKDQYNVYEAENGQTGLAFLKNHSPDIIISDVMMPDMDGLAFCKHVKSAPATSNIPFILLTARGSDEHKTEGYEIGADAYIPKPFHINYLKVRIKKLLEYRKRMDNLIKDGNINNHFVNVDLEQSDKEFLNALVKAVEQNLAESDLDASTLENALFISKMQLYRKLKTLAGMTPSEFIKRIRLKHAAMLLQNSKLTVSEIFYRTGFNNKSYFFREFKKIYHVAPNEYRLKQHDGGETSEIL